VARSARNWSGVVKSFSLAGSRRLHYLDSTSTRNEYSSVHGGASFPKLAPGDSALVLVETNGFPQRSRALLTCFVQAQNAASALKLQAD
jgi:hypothetical protein